MDVYPQTKSHHTISFSQWQCSTPYIVQLPYIHVYQFLFLTYQKWRKYARIKLNLKWARLE